MVLPNILLLFLGSVVADQAQDLSFASGEAGPCHALSVHNSSNFPISFVKPSEVNACMSQVKLNTTSAYDAINGTLSMLDIYSYEFYALDDRNPQLHLHVDLRAELIKLQKNISSIASMPEFSRKLSGILNSLQDGHTEIAIDCSGKIAFDAFLPLANVAATPYSAAKVMIHPHYDQFLADRQINDTKQFDLQRSLAGSTVLEINGVDVVSYLMDLTTDSDILFGMIDPQTRYNQLFVNLRGHPTPRIGYGVALTSLARSHVDLDELKLKVAFDNGTEAEFQLPWLGSVDTDFHKLTPHQMPFADYYSDYVCAQGNITDLLPVKLMNLNTKQQASVPSSDNRFHNRMKHVFDRADELAAKYIVGEKSNHTVAVSTETVLPPGGGRVERIGYVDSGFSIYQFLNTTVGVVYFTSFEGGETLTNASQGKYVSKYRQHLARGLQELEARGVTHLLIDISGNNGGRTELGSLAMLSLFPSQYPGFGTVIRSNTEMTAFLNGSDYEQAFARVDGTPFKSLTEFTVEANQTIDINGVNASYSQLFVDNLKDVKHWPIIGDAVFPADRLFSPSKMLIVTNGKCASTCAQVAMYLQDVHGVKSVGFGGMPGYGRLLQTVGGVRGAQVVEMLDPHDPQANMYNFTMRVSQMTINLRSAIHYERAIPTEYVTRNVDYHYHHTLETFNDFAKTWEFVATRHFPDAMKTEPKRPSRLMEWRTLREYPEGWFSRVQALHSVMLR